jgi:crotonobetainyl-CoA:carnitine CoA-transferase CaiB-like acyl-CoA transferase
MTDVLAGVRVLEVAEQGFVPSAAAVLADWGADVVKLERPEGDGLRAVMRQGLVAQTGDFDFLVEQVNRNKRNVCLDLKHRSAGARERLSAASPHAPHGAARREPGAVRRRAGRDPKQSARQG